MNWWQITILTFLLSCELFACYLAVMNLKRNIDQVTTVTKVFAYPILFVGAILDIAFNIIIGTIIFVQWPTRWLFTSRLNRNYGCGGWREKLALWFCVNLLDPFDPSGQHCKPRCTIDEET